MAQSTWLTPGLPSGMLIYVNGVATTIGGPQAPGGLEALRLATPQSGAPQIPQSSGAGVLASQFAGNGYAGSAPNLGAGMTGATVINASSATVIAQNGGASGALQAAINSGAVVVSG